jgi:hypothetical protein
MYLDENANDLDFEDSIDKNHATPTLHNELIKTLPSKLSSFLFIFERMFMYYLIVRN